MHFLTEVGRGFRSDLIVHIVWVQALRDDKRSSFRKYTIKAGVYFHGSSDMTTLSKQSPTALMAA